MNLFGYELTWPFRKELQAASPNYWGWFSSAIREPFAGAWQKNITPDKKENLLAFSAVFACVSLIAEDVAKLRLRIMEQINGGYWQEVTRNTPFAPVLRKPNHYQTMLQFIISWLTMKMLYGNTYVVKERDKRGVVTALYVLDSRMVTPLVADNGEVFYQIRADKLSQQPLDITLPASEVIHDRGLTLFHPLVGVSPIFACGVAATQGIRIQHNSVVFFENMSRPSGQLTAPGSISDDTARRLKEDFEANFSGGRIGRLLVTGDDMKYQPMVIPATDAQLIEQLRWTVEDVARCFRVPLHKIASGANPTFNNVSAMNQDYYTQTLQTHIEAIEALLDDGLNLYGVKDHVYSVEFDLEGLLRMDPATRADVAQKQVGAGVLAPNEARLRENLPPVKGGETPYLQQQNYSLAALAARDATNPLAAPSPALPAPPVDDDEDTAEEQVRALMLSLRSKLQERFGVSDVRA
ncbi:MAG: phage portal protein [Candidatus Hydrogenedentes bacterium]|jgi:HK97 family phage portal protein|nr:phage portal protein [Candidatus Hydrogenedentota bacterium]